jgi:hypothetical protein
MEIHFTVRLSMAKKKNISGLLERQKTSWTQVGDPSKELSRVQWSSPNGEEGLYEHRLGARGKEYELLDQWSQGLGLDPTDRGSFARIEVPNSEAGLQSFADFLREYMKFENGKLMPDVLYNGRDRDA